MFYLFASAAVACGLNALLVYSSRKWMVGGLEVVREVGLSRCGGWVVLHTARAAGAGRGRAGAATVARHVDGCLVVVLLRTKEVCKCFVTC